MRRQLMGGALCSVGDAPHYAWRCCPQDPTVRVPPLNWEAESYPDMFNWDNVTVIEPPVTVPLADSIIEGVRGQPLDLPSFPCHAHSVERRAS